MQLKQLSIFVFISLSSIISARPPGRQLTIKPNKTNAEEKAKVKHKTKLRRRNKQCDYLYENCKSEVDALNEASEMNNEDNNKRYEDFLENEQGEHINNKTNKHEDKLQLVDSLEDLSYLDDSSYLNTTPPDYENRPTKLSEVLVNRQSVETESTLKVWIALSAPDKEPTLPPEIGLCNNYAKCRIFPGSNT